MDVEKISGELKSFKLSKDLSVFLVCLLIASVFWLLNALTKFYSTVVDIPVEYVNIPEDKILARNNLPDQATVEINGSGFNLLSVTLFNSPDPVVIDYELGSKRNGFKKTESSFGPEYIRAQVMDEIPSEVSLGEISLDSLKLLVEEKVKVMKPVKASLSYSMEYPYFLNGAVTIDPASVELYGPSSSLAKIDSILTVDLDLGKTDKKLVKDMELALPAGIEANVATVRLSVPVDQYTEGQLEIPIEIINADEGDEIILFPSSVKVTYLVGLSEFEKVDGSDFSFVVDAQKITKGKSSLIVLNKSQPSDYQLQDFKPHKVEFIVKK